MRPSFFSRPPSMPRLSKCVHVRRCTRVQQDTSMVWLTCPTPSLLSECVHARLREPSTEPALVREAVRERARRVILAEGTERKREKEMNKSFLIHREVRLGCMMCCRGGRDDMLELLVENNFSLKLITFHCKYTRMTQIQLKNIQPQSLYLNAFVFSA